MTDEELKALVAENSRTIAENSRAIRELREESEQQRSEDRRQWEQLREQLQTSREESERIWQEVLASREASREESERIWQEVLASREASREESERIWQEVLASRREFGEEMRAAREESERIWQEVLASRSDLDRTITGLRREIGRLGNALGGYTESLLRPPLERLLRERFGMKSFHSPLHVKDGADELEIDLVGHAKDETPEVYAVEIKSKLRPDDFEQLFEHLRKLPRLLPEHRGKKIFGMLAALEIPDDLRTRAQREGIYLAAVRDDLVELTPPDDFEPRAFGLRGLG